MRRPIFRISLAAATLFVFAALVLPVAARQSQAQQPQTWQEAQNFRSGPTPFEPLMKFWYELDAMSDNVSIMPLTKTLLDREFTLVTIANHPVTTPQDAIRSGKTIVLIANAVHGICRCHVNGTVEHRLHEVGGGQLAGGDRAGLPLGAGVQELLGHRAGRY